MPWFRGLALFVRGLDARRRAAASSLDGGEFDFLFCFILIYGSFGLTFGPLMRLGGSCGQSAGRLEYMALLYYWLSVVF